MLATDRTYDYTLFTVENFAPVQKFGYLSWTPRARPRARSSTCRSTRPAEPTRIAGAPGDRAGNCAVATTPSTATPDSDVSYYCDTEGGSSGCPVLSRKTNKVVALHHFGGCPNSGVRADLLLAKLKSVL